MLLRVLKHLYAWIFIICVLTFSLLILYYGIKIDTRVFIGKTKVIDCYYESHSLKQYLK